MKKEVYIMNQRYMLETTWEYDWIKLRKTI